MGMAVLWSYMFVCRTQDEVLSVYKNAEGVWNSATEEAGVLYIEWKTRKCHREGDKSSRGCMCASAVDVCVLHAFSNWWSKQREGVKLFKFSLTHFNKRLKWALMKGGLNLESSVPTL